MTILDDCIGRKSLFEFWTEFVVQSTVNYRTPNNTDFKGVNSLIAARRSRPGRVKTEASWAPPNSLLACEKKDLPPRRSLGSTAGSVERVVVKALERILRT